jgi:hypothetical protein
MISAFTVAAINFSSPIVVLLIRFNNGFISGSSQIGLLMALHYLWFGDTANAGLKDKISSGFPQKRRPAVRT